MPVKRQCTTAMCPNYAVDGHSKCITHKKEYVRASFSKIKRTHTLYNTTAWQRLRAQHKRANPLCVECGERGTDVDHVIKHKGDRNKFYDPNNLQTMCKTCHNAKTGRGE